MKSMLDMAPMTIQKIPSTRSRVPAGLAFCFFSLAGLGALAGLAWGGGAA